MARASVLASAEGAQSKRQRAAHKKSRQGCLNCKRLHVKCDEGLPTCQRCSRMDIECERAAPPVDNVRFRGFRIHTVTTVRDAVCDDPQESVAIEYFHRCTLPILILCRPSIAWHANIKQLAQTSIALRKILVALGDQHRLVDAETSGASDCILNLRSQAELSYSRAIPSWRRSVAVQSMEEVTVLATGCLLLIIVECFRKDRAALTMHLTAGVRTIRDWSRSARNQGHRISGFAAEMIVLLDEFCENSASHRATSSLHSQSRECFRDGAGFDPSFLRTLSLTRSPSLELSSINRQSLSLTYELLKETLCRDDIPREFRSLDGKTQEPHELWPDAKDLLARLVEETDRDTLQSPQYAAAYASAAMNILRMTPADASPDRLASTPSYEAVLEALESALLSFQRLRDRIQPAPFSIGLSIIPILQLVAASTEGELCARALRMLELCPQKECLWDAKETLHACRESRRCRSTSVSDRSDAMSQWEHNSASERSQE